MTDTFLLNTLHRRKYMLCFLSLIFISGGISAIIPASEIIKIIIILFTIPLILYLSVRFSLNPSTWQVNDQQISIRFANKTHEYPLHEIDHIRVHTRSGGTLYIIYFKHKSPSRFWRNKLFQREDDNTSLQNKLSNSELPYYKF